MPTVPRRKAPSESLKPTRGGNIDHRYTPDDFGAGIGRALSQGAAQTGQVLAEKKQRADQISVQDSINQLVQYRVTDLMKEASQRKGRNAAGMGEDLSGLYAKRFEGLKAKLQDKDQQQMFNGWYAKNRVNVLSGFAKTENSEMLRYESETLEASAQRHQNMLMSDPDNVENVEQQRANMQGIIRRQSLIDGDGQAELTLKLEQLDSNITAGLIDQKLSVNDFKSAEAIYARAGDTLLGNQKSAVGKAIAKAGLAWKAQEIVDGVVKDGLNTGEALEAINQESDPEVRSKAKQQYRQHNSDMKAVKAENQQATVDSIVEQIKANGAFNVGSAEYDALPPATQKALETFSANRRNGYSPQTEVRTYDALVDKMADENSFKNIQLIEYVNKLSESDFKMFKQAQLDIKQGKGRGASAAKLKEIRSRNQVADDVMKSIGIDLSAKASKDEVKRANDFRAKSEDAIEFFFNRENRNPTPAEFRVIIDQLALEVAVPGTVWGTNDKPLFEVEFDEIDEEDRLYIKGSLESSGVAPTEENILSLFKTLKAEQAK